MKLQPECVSQIAEIIFQICSNVQAKTMYQERRWRNEEGSNFCTCRYSSIGFRCVWKKCCNGKQFRFGCFNGIGILAGGKWTESNPCESGNKFVSGVTEEYPVRWGEQLGQDTSFGDASFGDTSFRRASWLRMSGFAEHSWTETDEGVSKTDTSFFTCRENNTMLYWTWIWREKRGRFRKNSRDLSVYADMCCR